MKISEEMLIEIMDMLEEGKSFNEVISHYYRIINVPQVRDALLRNERGKKILLKEIEEKMPIPEIIELSNQGKTFKQIANELGLHVSFLTSNINEYEFILGKKY